MNKVTLYGRLAHTPEVKKMPNGNSVATMSLATNYSYKDQQGNKVEEVDWHNLVSYGKQAEVLGQYCEGGQQMLFTGRIVTRKWDDKTTGEKKSKTEIIVDGFEFGAKSQARADRKAQETPTQTPDVVPGGYNGEGFAPNPDDIPFS